MIDTKTLVLVEVADEVIVDVAIFAVVAFTVVVAAVAADPVVFDVVVVEAEVNQKVIAIENPIPPISNPIRRPILHVDHTGAHSFLARSILYTEIERICD